MPFLGLQGFRLPVRNNSYEFDIRPTPFRLKGALLNFEGKKNLKIGRLVFQPLRR